MPEVLVATVAAFAIGAVYYSLAAGEGGETPPWKLAVEVLRCLVVATVVAGLAERGDIDTPAGGLALGLALWIAFPLVQWTGALIWEGVPVGQAVLHAGDWLAKLLAVAAIVSVMS